MRALFRLLALALLLTVSAAHGQSAGGAGAPDPNILSYIGVGQTSIPLLDTAGKTLATSQTVDTTKKNLVIISAGQSNIVNTAPAAYSIVNTGHIFNLFLDNGSIYNGADPLLGPSTNIQAQTPGCTGNCLGHVTTILADQLITDAKFDNVYLVPIAVGGTSIAQWAPGGVLSNRIASALGRLAAHGITTSTTNVTIVILWAQGEADEGLGTSQAAYTASFNAMVTAAGSRATGVKWFVAKETYVNGSTSATVQAAQTAASPSGVINNAAGIYLGANADALTGASACSGSAACRQADGIHFTTAGTSSFALDATNGWKQALHASGAPF